MFCAKEGGIVKIHKFKHPIALALIYLEKFLSLNWISLGMIISKANGVESSEQ